LTNFRKCDIVVKKIKMPTKYNDKWLRASFRMYNRRYWHDVLPADLLVGFCKTNDSWSGITHFDENGQPYEVLIDSGLTKYPRYARLVLLHELAHVAVGNKERAYHGKLWKQERKRLLEAGAFTQLI
jgi:hypothetical protein